MRRILGLLLLAAVAGVGLTACMGDDEGSAREQRRAAALVNTAGGEAAGAELTIAGLTPVGQAIEVDSHSWGVTNLGPNAAQFEGLNFTKRLDEMSPLLFKGAASGTPYTSAILKLNKTVSGEAPFTYATYELSNAQVTSLQQGSSGGVPTESVSLKYTKLKLTYTSQTKDGKNPTTSFSWDLATSKGA